VSEEDNELRVVFRTSQYGEAAALTAMLNDATIPAEMLGANQNTMMVPGGGGEMFAIRIIVPATREGEAIAVIEDYMKSIGAAPQEEAPEAAEPDALLACPNCETVGIMLHRPCPGCGYEIQTAHAPLAFVKEHARGALTFCPECRDPLTLASGQCRTCSEELEPLESGDLLCPTLEHVLYRDTVGGIACKACKRVWVDVAA
jgi:hypothetical protein